MFSNQENFQFANNCLQSSLAILGHNQENHSEITYEDISDLLRVNFESFSHSHFLETQKKLILGLHEHKSKIAELIKKTEKDLMTIKLAFMMQVNEEKMIGHFSSILKGDGNQMKEITCAEMKKIVELTERSLDPSKSNEKKLMKKMSELITKI